MEMVKNVISKISSTSEFLALALNDMLNNPFLTLAVCIFIAGALCEQALESEGGF